MKNLFLLSLILSSALVANAAENGRAETSFVRVFDIIGSQNVLSLSPAQLSERLKGLCWDSNRTGIKRIKYGNVECLDEVSVKTFTIPEKTENNINLITASFSDAEKYAYALKRLTKTLGKPVGKNSETITWKMKPLKKGRGGGYAELQFVKDENVFYFSIGEEDQGP